MSPKAVFDEELRLRPTGAMDFICYRFLHIFEEDGNEIKVLIEVGKSEEGNYIAEKTEEIADNIIFELDQHGYSVVVTPDTAAFSTFTAEQVRVLEYGDIPLKKKEIPNDEHLGLSETS